MSPPPPAKSASSVTCREARVQRRAVRREAAQGQAAQQVQSVTPVTGTVPSLREGPFWPHVIFPEGWPPKGGGSFSNTDFGSFSNTDVLDHFRTQSGSFSNTWGGLSCGTRGVGGGGGVGQLLSPRTACPSNCALGLGEGGNQEAPSPKLPWLFELRCPRRLAPVGPRKAVKARSNGRNNSRGKLKGRYYSVKKP